MNSGGVGEGDSPKPPGWQRRRTNRTSAGPVFDSIDSGFASSPGGSKYADGSKGTQQV